MKLSELIQRSECSLKAFIGDGEVTGITSDSRTIAKGDLFVCMPSRRTDTTALAPAAVKAGATAVISSDPRILEMHRQLAVPVMYAPSVDGLFESAVWRLAHCILLYPSRSMRVIGVTGTNGKTTTAWLLAGMMEALFGSCAYLGTLGFMMKRPHQPEVSVDVGNTTPFSVDLAKFLFRVKESGIRHVAMEVSSHALAERRVDGVEFDAAVFTNLTQDHLDYHGTMDAYEAAKKRLFYVLPERSSKKFVGAINLDDLTGEEWFSHADFKALGCSLKGNPRAALQGELLAVTLTHVHMRLRFGAEEAEMNVPLGGLFNASNIICAAAGALAIGVRLHDVARALEKAKPVPGRFEPVPNDLGIGVLVDYAHTPDALEKLLASVRDLKPRRIITVFGCGGDRDRTKRPKMAAAASSLSDFVVLTSDNPRTEDPEAIIRETAVGLVAGVPSETRIDRPEAIALAIERAEEGDVVVIAGKGHEAYQIVGTVKHPMDDRLLAKAALERRKEVAGR